MLFKKFIFSCFFSEKFCFLLLFRFLKCFKFYLNIYFYQDNKECHVVLYFLWSVSYIKCYKVSIWKITSLNSHYLLVANLKQWIIKCIFQIIKLLYGLKHIFVASVFVLPYCCLTHNWEKQLVVSSWYSPWKKQRTCFHNFYQHDNMFYLKLNQIKIK